MDIRHSLFRGFGSFDLGIGILEIGLNMERYGYHGNYFNS
jgi:hypothetical protein